MTIETFREFFLWCTVINYGILVVWFFFFTAARDWMYALHSRWFNISQPDFDKIHYTCMAMFKIGIFLLNLVPLIVLYIIH